MNIDNIKKVGCDYRVTIPPEMRQAAELNPCDTIKFERISGGIAIRKVSLFEVGEHTEEARNSYAFASIAHMGRNELLEALRLILKSLEGDGSNGIS